MDIRFYNFEFELLYILPQCGRDKGIISMNTTIDFNDCGSFELVFKDEELVSVIKQNVNHLIITWKDFQGYVTGFLLEDNNYRIFGEHLNGLLRRRVIPLDTSARTGTVEEIACSVVSEHYDFLSVERSDGFLNTVEFSKDSYTQGHTYIQDLLNSDGAGYKITADLANHAFYFKVLKSKENPIMFSENNLNAYGFSENYDNKSRATGGWYLKKEEIETEDGATEKTETWTHLDAETEQGIYKIDLLLSQNTENEARNALSSASSVHEITAKTRNVVFHTDYNIGDIVRFQNGNDTVIKKVESVNQWLEGEYGEEPVLKEVKG